MLAIGIVGMVLVRTRISPQFRARNAVEQLVEWALIGCSLIAVLTTVGIILSVAFEAARFFGKVPWYEFIFGLEVEPADRDSRGPGGFVRLVRRGAALRRHGARSRASRCSSPCPIGLFSAIYLAEYAHRNFRAWTKPFLEVLAGIPTVVYGFFAALTVGPMLRGWGESIGLPVASESALAAGLVMGIMIVPFVSSLADDMITAVPQSLRDGALRARRDEVRDDQAGGRARGAAGHRRRCAARHLARHRRDDDRGDGGGSRRESHRQSSKPSRR